MGPMGMTMAKPTIPIVINADPVIMIGPFGLFACIGHCNCGDRPRNGLRGDVIAGRERVCAVQNLHQYGAIDGEGNRRQGAGENHHRTGTRRVPQIPRPQCEYRVPAPAVPAQQNDGGSDAGKTQERC